MSTEAAVPVNEDARKHNKWLATIAGYKFLQALVLGAVGFGALHFLHSEMGVDDALADLMVAIKANPESHFINFLLYKASLVDEPMLRRIGAIAFSYAGLSCAEGIGLYLEKAWGEILTLIITASFLPWEIFELLQKLTWVRCALLIINLLVFLYLLKFVSTRHRGSASPRAAEPVGAAVEPAQHA